MNQCYDCQYKERKDEIGPNMEAFEDWMQGNTMVIMTCGTCGEETGILPKGDMDRAIRASNNKIINPLEWD